MTPDFNSKMTQAVAALSVLAVAVVGGGLYFIAKLFG